MAIHTHQRIDQRLCGVPVAMETEYCHVRLQTRPEMAADDSGLVHGGFVFGLADYAAMLAVNHPNVVLGSASVKFVKPVTVGETIHAEARIVQSEGRKRRVGVTVQRAEETVCEGEFTCFVPDRHVLTKFGDEKSDQDP
jgi:uncharacterized protein (TIGR00369 family)